MRQLGEDLRTTGWCLHGHEYAQRLLVRNMGALQAFNVNRSIKEHRNLLRLPVKAEMISNDTTVVTGFRNDVPSHMEAL